jgi:hypothetical protein
VGAACMAAAPVLGGAGDPTCGLHDDLRAVMMYTSPDKVRCM